MFSQNLEEKYILEYFQNKPAGTLLDIGANDGQTFSNSLALIMQGWSACLVEPSEKAYGELRALHAGNHKTICFCIAITDKVGLSVMHDSGTHLNKGDTALLSTLCEEDYNKWKPSTQFTSTTVQTWDIETLLKAYGKDKFAFITIDAEGMDMVILKQLNLTELGCQLICIEHNGNYLPFLEYIQQFGLKTIYMNAENIIMGL